MEEARPSAAAPGSLAAHRQQSVRDTAALIEQSRKAEVTVFGSLEQQLVENDNPAVALSFVGFMLAICIVISGPRTPALIANDFGEFAAIVYWSFIGMALLGVSAFINSRVLLHSLLSNNSLLSGNAVTGLVEAAAYISSAWIIRATISGGEVEVPFGESIGSALIYFVLGQLAQILSAIILQWITPYDDQEEAKKGNLAAGIKFAGNQLALGLITSSPLLKSESLAAFAIYFALGSIVLVALRWMLSKFILPIRAGRTVDDEIKQDQNWGLALVEACISIAVAYNLDTLLNNPPCPSFALAR